ncbi:MAG: repair protein RecN [Pseudonocardiales bacterium]|nr:repair protein RecN [Pseudonocardiales bacterium]
MLDELRIRGLGVIDEAVLPLGPGLTVVTGETGAGKTMVVTGLLLLFGGRADSARVRTGTDQASVDGRLLIAPGSPVVDRVHDAGGELDDGCELVLRRVVGAGGRSRAYVGGAAAPVAVLADLAEHLVAVHGQSDQLRLVRPGAQRAALDRYAAIDLGPFAVAYADWRDADAQLTDRSARAAELRRESDLLTHGVAEIEAVAPELGEAEELTRLAARLGHADALTLAARTAHDAILGDPSDPATEAADVLSLLGVASRALAQQQGDDTELDGLASRLTELSSLAADLGADFGGYAEQLDTDPARLEQVESRRAALGGLVRKYCDEPEPSVDAVLRWADAARTRLAEIDVSDEALAALRARRDAAAGAVAELATKISARRRAAATSLADAVSTELAGLAMPDARLDVDVHLRPATAGTPVLIMGGESVGITADGADEVDLLLQPHPGAPALPIGRGASGGELSRVMLALEVCLAGTDPVPTMVFDEVDAGVGGRAAVEVGRRLARLARERQVLVVTHLPQVAAFADRHIVVDKPRSDTESGGVTASDVRLVTDEDRVAELARMLAGSDTATAREHAAELLADAASEARGKPLAGRKPARRRPVRSS